jgi:hypothetical protein
MLAGDFFHVDCAITLHPVDVFFVLEVNTHREAEFFAGRPAPPVQHVLLQKAEEELHGGVVSTGPDAAHRPVKSGSTQVVIDRRPGLSRAK